MDTSSVAITGRRRRRRHSPEFKASVVKACRGPGVSIAAIALANGLNANMLRKWVLEAEGSKLTTQVEPRSVVAHAPSPFMALTPASAPGEIRIEVQRGTTTIKVSWPAQASSACSAWLREWLR